MLRSNVMVVTHYFTLKSSIPGIFSAQRLLGLRLTWREVLNKVGVKVTDPLL